MLVSIITVVKNNKNFISHTLESIASQTYKNIELIVIDGGSQDFTDIIVKKYFKKFKIIVKKDKNVYEGINFAQKIAKGQFLTLLHAGDIYFNENIISQFVQASKKNDILTSNIFYYDSNLDIKRVWRVKSKSKFSSHSYRFPHTGFFYSSKVYKNFIYDDNYKISADSKFLNLLSKKNLIHKHLNFFSIGMYHKGLSTNISTLITRTVEDFKYLREHNKVLFLILYLFKIFEKLKQFRITQSRRDYLKLKLKKFYTKLEEQLIKKKIYFIQLQKFKNKIKLIKNPNTIINSKKNFILSALNLAFLASFFSEKIILYKNLYHWPDGYLPLMLYKEYKKIKKIPGRKLLQKLKFDKKIKRIHVLGNLDNYQKNLLERLYKKKIFHTNLPYGDKYKIVSFCPRLKQNTLYFLTIPTPKQEEVAELLAVKNNFYKIILIGGAINILSLKEKPVPERLNYFEFLWRLRFETKARLKRLFITIFQFFYNYFLKNKKINV